MVQKTLPWLAIILAQLLKVREQGRFPAALLIHDRPGLGGLWLAEQAARALLCRESGAPCGKCRDCQRFAAGQHPDFYRVGLQEDAKQIKIEQVRELTEALSLTSHGQGSAVSIIAPADAMNTYTANALLKTLEEPRAGAYLILVSDAPSRLPATILSRCQRLSLKAPERAQIQQWLVAERGAGDWEGVLEVIGPAPLLALELDPKVLRGLREQTAETLGKIGSADTQIPTLAERWVKEEQFGLRLRCIENWLTVRLEQRLGGGPVNVKLSTGAQLSGPGTALNMRMLCQLLEQVQDLRRQESTSLNRALALEQVLWQWRQGVRTEASGARSAV